jgi:hypothetical protein
MTVLRMGIGSCGYGSGGREREKAVGWISSAGRRAWERVCGGGGGGVGGGTRKEKSHESVLTMEV